MAVTGTLACRSRVCRWAFCLALGLLMAGMMPGCFLEQSAAFDVQAFERYITGQTDELPPNLPPDEVESWKQSRREMEQAKTEMQATIQHDEKVNAAYAEVHQELMRLPEGYSQPITGAEIPRPVVVTATYSLGLAVPTADVLKLARPSPGGEGASGAQARQMESALAGLAGMMQRQSSSHAQKQEMGTYGRVRVIRLLLEDKTFEQILATSDPESPLVTDDALLLHVDQTEGRWSGVLRDQKGRQASFEFPVVRRSFTSDDSGSESARGEVSYQRQLLAENMAMFKKAFVPAIMECYGKMK